MKKKAIMQWAIKTIIRWAIRRALADPERSAWFVKELVSSMDTTTLVKLVLRTRTRINGSSS
jgi:hypothetical protein